MKTITKLVLWVGVVVFSYPLLFYSSISSGAWMVVLAKMTMMITHSGFCYTVTILPTKQGKTI